jgi:uncharacterized protein (TIGR03084 family)
VRDQVGHLATSEDLAHLAASDPPGFASALARFLADLPAAIDAMVAKPRALAAHEVLDWWRASRQATAAALRAHRADDRLPWVGTEMSATSFATARLMETWAHGQDIVDGLGMTRSVTKRLRHVALLGVQTMAFSYRNRGLEPPADPVKVVLTDPDLVFGPPDANDSVTGTTLDFCLVVTQRRNPADTALVVAGPIATEWMSIAQAFAGPPTANRRPLSGGVR